MTHEKARDFFSSYHEGSLEPGLRVSFEHKLEDDPSLRAEYEQFASTLDQLSVVHEVPIEIPFDLNERIAARLDRHLWEQKQIAPKAWFVRLRLVAFGVVATALLVGAGISIKNHGDGRVVDAGIGGSFPQSGSSDQLSVSVKQDHLTVEYAPQSRKTVIFLLEPDTNPFAELTLDKDSRLKRSIENKNPATDLVRIQVLDTPKVDQAIIAVPGTMVEKAKSGSGTLEEFAKALAAQYRVPVWLNGIKDPLMQVNWDLKETDARRAAESALKGQFTVDLREGNLITISGG